MSDFCRQRQMSVSSFSSLHRRYAGKHSSAKASPAAAQDAPSAAVFLPVKIVEGRPVAAVVTKSSLLVSAKFPLSHAAISAPQLLDCEALLASL